MLNHSDDRFQQYPNYQLLMIRPKTKVQSSGVKSTQQEPTNKIYVPISTGSEKSSEKTQEKASIIIAEKTDMSVNLVILQLRRSNAELKQKEQIYIDKLIKLQEGLQRQHEQFIQLQELYNQLFTSYKRKQEQISELQFKSRQSNRKKQGYQSQEGELKKQCAQLKQQIGKLQATNQENNKRNTELQKTIDKLCMEVSYFKAKQKMVDSRASLNTKVFEELGEWQRQADIEKEQKIKLEYENKFLKSRHDDLQNRVQQLQEIVKLKQSEVLKLRQSSIMLSRSNSENKFLKSTSRSPNGRSADKQNSDRSNRVIDSLHAENKALKKQLDNIKYSQSPRNSSPKYEHFIRQQQFFSFSRDEPQIANSICESPESKSKSNTIHVEQQYEIGQQESESNHDSSAFGTSELQQLPVQLSIEKIIQNSRRNKFNKTTEV